MRPSVGKLATAFLIAVGAVWFWIDYRTVTSRESTQQNPEAVALQCQGWPAQLVSDPEQLPLYTAPEWQALRVGDHYRALHTFLTKAEGSLDATGRFRAWLGLSQTLFELQEVTTVASRIHLDFAVANSVLPTDRELLLVLRASLALQAGETLSGSFWLDQLPRDSIFLKAARELRLLEQELKESAEADAVAMWLHHLESFSASLPQLGCEETRAKGRLQKLVWLLANPGNASEDLPWVELQLDKPDFVYGCGAKDGLSIGVWEPGIYAALSRLALEKARKLATSVERQGMLSAAQIRLGSVGRREEACRLSKALEADIAVPEPLSLWVYGEWLGAAELGRELERYCSAGTSSLSCPASDDQVNDVMDQQLAWAVRCEESLGGGEPELASFLGSEELFSGVIRRRLTDSLLWGGRCGSGVVDEMLRTIDGERIQGTAWESLDVPLLWSLENLRSRQFDVATTFAHRLAAKSVMFGPMFQTVRLAATTVGPVPEPPH